MNAPEALPASPIPVALGLPLLGDTLAYLRDPTATFQRRYEAHGEVSITRMLGNRWVMMLGPDALQAVLQNRDEAYSNSGWEVLIGRLFPRGLMLLDGAEHRLHRRILQAAFTREALNGYLAGMRRRVDAALAGWQPGRLHFFEAIKQLTLDVGTEVFAGVEPNAGTARINRCFLDAVQAAGTLLRLPLPGTLWWRGLRGRAELERWVASRLAEVRARPGSDMMSRLAAARGDDGELFSDRDIIDHLIFLLMAAHDTSAISLTGLIHRLAVHPDWQQRLREEALALPAEPDIPALEAMVQTGRVFRETLRLMAPVPVLLRRVVRPVRFKQYALEPGMNLVVSPWHVHHMAQYWHEPERFDPDRFAPPRAEDRAHPFLWSPFGGGAHKCIGLHFGEMEVKLILARLLQRFRWSLPPGYQMPLNMTSLPIPRDGLPIHLEALG